MRIWILEYVEQVSENWHCGGGLAVIAKDIAHAKELVQAGDHLEVTPEEWDTAIEIRLADPADPRVIRFPDAGCC